MRHVRMHTRILSMMQSAHLHHGHSHHHFKSFITVIDALSQDDFHTQCAESVTKQALCVIGKEVVFNKSQHYIEYPSLNSVLHPNYSIPSPNPDYYATHNFA